MTAADRRLEIISILVVSGHTTSKELARGIVVRHIGFRSVSRCDHFDGDFQRRSANRLLWRYRQSL